MGAFSVELRGVTKEFGGRAGESVVAVDNIDLQIGHGELVTLLGPSGCGKTTTLRMIGGFESPTSGEVFLDGKPTGALPPNKRDTSMVFQSYALFPHMDVFENVAYGLKVKGRHTRAEIRQKVLDMLGMVGLSGLESRSAGEISGGQQQRVALARALVNEPKVLLFDEPLSNLDAKLRVQMRTEIRKLQQRLSITSIYVTHDQEEAMSLSDRIVVMKDGRIEQEGSPQQIYAMPKTRFVADFIGKKANFIEATVVEIGTGRAVVDVLGRHLTVRVDDAAGIAREGVGRRVTFVARPEAVKLTPTGAFTGTVEHATYLGSHVVYEVASRDVLLTVEVSNPQENGMVPVGSEVRFDLPGNNANVLVGAA